LHLFAIEGEKTPSIAKNRQRRREWTQGEFLARHYILWYNFFRTQFYTAAPRRAGGEMMEAQQWIKDAARMR
jgi:hypothetical protein